MELFWTRGYRGTTTRELESSLGVKQSSLYNAFGSKHGLLDAALDRYEAEVVSWVFEPLETSEQGLESLDRFFSRVADWLDREGRHGCLMLNLMAEAGTGDAGLLARSARYRKRVQSALQAALERAIRKAETHDSSVEVRASLLASAFFGICICARGGSPQDELRAMIEGARLQIRDWRVGLLPSDSSQLSHEFGTR